MTPEQKTAWVKALRSGEYKRGEGFLKRVCSSGLVLHCALGVFGEITGALKKQESDDSDLYTSFDGKFGGTSLLPAYLLSFDYQSHVHTLNDAGYSFAAIADMIESGEWDEPIRNSELP